MCKRLDWCFVCVCASLYVSFVLWCKKLFASPRYTCLEPWLFCCITGCEEFLKQQQKEVEVFMENPIRPLIQYGGLLVWNGDHRFAISKKD